MVSWTKKTTPAGKSCAPQLASTTVKVTSHRKGLQERTRTGQKEYNRWANKFDNIIIQQQELDLLAHPINLLSSDFHFYLAQATTRPPILIKMFHEFYYPRLRAMAWVHP